MTVDIAGNINRVRTQIDQFADGRHVDLMLAAKYQSVDSLVAAIEAGGTLMGHNLVQQLVAAGEGLADRGYGTRITTTVIGHVQSNKLSAAMAWADRIDTVDTLRTAERIARRQAERISTGTADAPYPILLQVNSAGATSQFGCDPTDLIDLARTISSLDTVRIDGVMTIGARGDEQAIRASFALTRRLSDELRSITGLENADVISMGMSGDMRIAIEEGSTLIRVGTAIFGERPAR